MSLEKEVLNRAQEWSDLDPNETTSAYVQELLKRISSPENNGTTTTTNKSTSTTSSNKAAEELQSLFPPDNKRIEFGTAGLRSTMKPGPVGMNDLVVVQAAQGIAKYVLKENQNTGQQKICAVIGYDHRKNPDMDLSSLSFALLSALVFEQAGMEVQLLNCPSNEGYVITPMVPFTLSNTEHAKLGIMITASHNPKQDAGYKVYWRNGCQIRPPVDKGMANSILENLTPWVDYGALLKARKEKNSDPCLGLSNPELTNKMMEEYFSAIKDRLVTGQAKLLEKDGWKPPKIAYSAMHGIGHNFAVRSFQTFGLEPFHAIPSQSAADPEFPTVPFPNPEEKGALDIAKKFCEENGLDVILANDPDADRLAVAEKDRKTGSWTVFTGDQIGTMLGCWLYEKVGKPSGKPVSMCASTVSSKMLAEVGKKEGFTFEDTLTGFKWIGSRSEELSQEGYLALFGYEEAIGFCCGDVVFDKDGISALGVFTELTYSAYHSGSNLAQHMQSLYDKYGEFVSNNGYYFISDPSVVPKIMDVMTCNGQYNLSTVGPYEVDSLRFLGEPGYDSTVPNKKPKLATSKSSPMMTISFKNGCIAQFRGSGTEPKFKYYIEMKGKPGVDRKVVEEELAKFSDIILEELVQPDKHGLKKVT